MDCNEFLDRYSDYDDSLVSAGEIEGFRAHMAGCDACARYDRVLRKGRMLARQVPAPQPSGAFVPRLHMRLWRENGRAARRAARTSQLAAVLPALTLILALTAVMALLADPAGEPEVRVADTVWGVAHAEAVTPPPIVIAAVEPVTRGEARWAARAPQARQAGRSGHVGGASIASAVVSDPVDGHPVDAHRTTFRPGRAVSLPPVQLASALVERGGWTSGRVDREPLGSYSPLTMGPPAYGVARSR
jgi:hypothetical protein